jgi:queuine tRNA-ribosyltransferase
LTKARAGVVHTPHGVVETPVFMPVGTQASVKALGQQDLRDLGARILLGNAYHLYLRPGVDTIAEAGGLHRFMGWDRAILTDSGGFQVRSLASLNKITEEGVLFQSHVDGSRHLFTPEEVIRFEHKLGADIIVAFDECAPYPCDRAYAQASGERTLRWAGRCVRAYDALERRSQAGEFQALFGVIQGSTYADLRDRFAEEMLAFDLAGYAVGGACVGEPKAMTWEAVEVLDRRLPADRPRYLMGCGPPDDLAGAVLRGIDMFDCVIPTRNARNGTVFTRQGRMRLRKAKYARDFAPIDRDCGCYACRNYSRAYIRHLLRVNELLGFRLATVHSLHFYFELMQEMRNAILADRFGAWFEAFHHHYLGEEALSVAC